MIVLFFFFFSSRRRHTRSTRDWSSDVCSSDLGDVALGADDLAGKDRRDALAQFDDLADELVPNHQWRVDGVLRPLVPAVDVEVGAADAGAEDADQNLARTRLRLRDVLQPESGLGLCFDECFHCWPIIGSETATGLPHR